MILFILIFFAMVIVIGASSVVGFSFFLKRQTKRLKSENQKHFDSAAPPPFRSLFEPSEKELEIFQKDEDEKLFAERRETLRGNLMTRASKDDLGVLREVKASGDFALYNELLDLLLKNSETDAAKLLRLADFVSENELPTNENLAQIVLTNWKKNSSFISAAKFLHVSALSDSAENYSKTIDEILMIWKQNKLKISGGELFALFESHYWLLANESRNSGAGFVLKEKLAKLRGELFGN